MTNQPHRKWLASATALGLEVDSYQYVKDYVDAMQGIPYGRPPMAVEPVLIRESDYDRLCHATAGLVELHKKAVRHLAPTRPGRLKALGADLRDFPRFTEDERFEFEYSGIMARPDVVVGAHGPQFIEFNFGGGANGMVQFELARQTWTPILEKSLGRGSIVSTSPFSQIAQMLVEASRALDTSHEVELVGSLKDPGLSERYFAAQLDLLSAEGVTARFRELSEAASNTPTSRTLGLIQFHEREARENGWDVSSIRPAMNAGMVGIPSMTSRLLDSKKILGILSEGRPWMSQEETDLVAQYVPWTRVMSDRDVTWRGDRANLVELLRSRKDEFVLKGAAGLLSQEVHFGSESSPSEWSDLVWSATRSGYYVAQEVVVSVREPVLVMDNPDVPPRAVGANAVVSPFFAGGRTTGCHFRFDGNHKSAPVNRPSGAVVGCMLAVKDHLIEKGENDNGWRH